MFARQVSFQLKPGTREELIQMFDREILPLLQKQNGFTDEITLVDSDGKQVLAISLWDSQESADNYNRETYPQVLKTLMRVIQGTPEVRNYEAVISTFHKTAIL